MNLLREWFERLRNLICRRRIEYWDLETCKAERRESGLCFDLDTEEEVLLVHGEPTLIEDADGNMVSGGRNGADSDACRWLIYDQLLRRTREMFHIVNGHVEGSALVPKLKRCPPQVRSHVAAYYSPEGNGS